MALFSGKSVLVTGSTQGIGAACARHFAREGAALVLNGRHDGDAVQALLAELRAWGRQVEFIAADVGAAGSAAGLVDQAAEALGCLDVLVNNAGVERSSAFWDSTEEDYDLVMNTNLKGPFFATQAFVRHCRSRQKAGAVVNMSSVHEDLAFPGFASYCASKGGLRMLTRDLAVELAPLGIRINNVAPGAIATPINRDMRQDPRALRELLQNIPQGRLGTPDDVAEMVLFLASSRADYVTGSTFVVDGGLLRNYHEG